MIGSNLARHLVKANANVFIIDNMASKHGANTFNLHNIQDKVIIVIADMGDQDITNKLVRDKDYIFNLAGQSSHIYSIDNPLSDLNSNVKSQLVLLEACRNHNPEAKIIFTSTRQVYGIPNKLPVDENHSLAPIDFNGHHKLMAEEYHKLYYKIHGIRSIILRLTNTYGRGMRIKDGMQNFLGLWIRKILENDTIQIFGTGEQIRDFNYVDDVIYAILKSSLNDECNGEIYNLGCDTHYTLSEVANLLIDIAGKGVCKYVPFPESRKLIDIGSYYSDTHKIKQCLQWEPKWNLQEGLADVLSYYKDNLNHYCQ